MGVTPSWLCPPVFCSKCWNIVVTLKLVLLVIGGRSPGRHQQTRRKDGVRPQAVSSASPSITVGALADCRTIVGCDLWAEHKGGHVFLTEARSASLKGNPEYLRRELAARETGVLCH